MATITIGVPVYNGAKLLREFAIETGELLRV